VEKLQLRPTFPGKPLIKTNIALWESCRSIVPLQLLFLEIFKCVDIFKSYTILKLGKWNENVHRRRRHPPGARSPPALVTCRSCRRRYGRFSLLAVDPCTPLAAPQSLRAVHRVHQETAPGQGPRAARPTASAFGSHAAEPAGVPPFRAPIPRPIAPCCRSIMPHRRSPCSPCVRASYWAQPSRARPPPTVAATAASSGNTRIRRPLLLFSPPATIPVAGAPPGRQTRRHAGLQWAQPLRPVVGARRRRDRPGFSLKSTRVNTLGTPGTSSDQVRPPPALNLATGEVSPPPGTTLQERRYFQGDLCKFPGTQL
jgi:hypothetical protein